MSDTRPAAARSRAEGAPVNVRRRRGSARHSRLLEAGVVASSSNPRLLQVVPEEEVRPITSASRHSCGSVRAACGGIPKRERRERSGRHGKASGDEASAGMVAVAYFCATKVTPHRTAVVRSSPSAPRRLMPPPTAECSMPSDLLDLDQCAGEVFRCKTAPACRGRRSGSIAQHAPPLL
jgi:hypothetical protein